MNELAGREEGRPIVIAAQTGPVTRAGLQRRERLLAGLTLAATVGLAFGLPFALQAGRVFFMPLTAAMVVAIALVPLLEGLERRRVPPGLAAFLCVALFLVGLNVVLAAIVVPAADWLTQLPRRLTRIQTNLAPVLELFKSLQHFVDNVLKRLESGQPVGRPATPALAPPSSVLQLLATSAPAALIEMFYALLLVFFFLAGWTRLKRRAIGSRSSMSGAFTTARVLRDVVAATSSYLGTITIINISLGLLVALGCGVLGMSTPLMWGGLVAVLNYVPYLGPIFASLLLLLGGLMSFTTPWLAVAPALMMISFHVVEANVVTPMIVGRHLSINPLLILISISFWYWVWGALGALLAVPLLIIGQRVLASAGVPDIAGFLFEHGTLTHDAPAVDEAGRRA